MFRKSLLIEDNTVRVGEGRISYPHLFIAVPSTLNPEPKYSLDFLIPKSNTEAIEVIKLAIAKATEKGIKTYWNGVKPIKFNDQIIKDGDAQYTSEGRKITETEGYWVIRADSKETRKPGVYDDSRGIGREVLNENDTERIYGGCWGWLVGAVIAYDTPAQKGVKIYLNSFIKSRDDEPFGGSARALAAALADDDDIDEDDLPF